MFLKYTATIDNWKLLRLQLHLTCTYMYNLSIFQRKKFFGHSTQHKAYQSE